jgi:hypothetical protein
VLIEAGAHDGVMFGYLLITLLVIVGPLACLAGVDSRIDERSRERRFSG